MKGCPFTGVEAVHLGSLKTALQRFIRFVLWSEVQDVPFPNPISS